MISCPVCFSVPADRVLNGTAYRMCACSKLDMVAAVDENRQIRVTFTFHYGRRSRLVLGASGLLYRHEGGDFGWRRIPAKDLDENISESVELARTRFAASVLNS